MYRRRRAFALGTTALLIFVFLAGAYVYPGFLARSEVPEVPPTGELPGVEDPSTPVVPPEKEDPKPEPVPFVHPKVRGIYVSAWIASTPSLLDPLLQWVEDTVLNAVVIDVKDDYGKIPWRTEVPWALQYGAFDTRLRNIDALMVRLAEAEIYPIARLVAFKDSSMAEARPELAVRTTSGAIWRDRTGAAWLDPHNWRSWQYLIDVAKEAASKGFKEIQFDYVRFPSDGNLSIIRYPHATGASRVEVIAAFLAEARSQLEPLGVKVSADIFGLVTSLTTNDMGIGQMLEDIYDVIEVVCPMVYPEHYALGTYGIPDPDKEPYLTVLRSLTYAKERLEAHPNADKVIMRPWLQDFTLRHTYGVAEIQAQIKAVYDAGFEEWLLWDPRCRYTKDAISTLPPR
jgi:hypothetical protein